MSCRPLGGRSWNNNRLALHALPNRPSRAKERGMAKTDELNKIIYSMIGVGKVYNAKQVLKEIALSYFCGAKIGVLGLNWAGKSALLRIIMAGVEAEFFGETHCASGYTIGFLEKEPELDPDKTVLVAAPVAVRYRTWPYFIVLTVSLLKCHGPRNCGLRGPWSRLSMAPRARFELAT